MTACVVLNNHVKMTQDEDIVCESREVYHGPVSSSPEVHKSGNKYRKLLFLFRPHHKDEKLKIFDTDAKAKKKKTKKTKDSKKNASNADERKEIIQKNMENSWVELPNTLKRKREKISQERLSEYHDEEDSKNRKSDDIHKPNQNALKNGFPDISSYLQNRDDGFRNTCERFRDLSEKANDSAGNESTSSDNLASQTIIFETHPIIHFDGSVIDDDPISQRVDQIISNGSGFQKVDESFERKTEAKSLLIDSSSSDSVINDSSVSSSSSEASHHDDSGTDVGSGELAKKPFKEMVSEFEKICTQNLAKNNGNNILAKKCDSFKNDDTAEMKMDMEPKHQYSDILFDVHPNNEGMFVNKGFEETKEVGKHPIVYQELSFEKISDLYDEVSDGRDEPRDPEEPRKSHLNADEKAKKQSAEAIAKELSMGGFGKKTKNPKTFDKHREEFLKSLGYDISVTKTDGSIVDSVKKTVIALEPPEKEENYYSVSNLLEGPGIAEEPTEEEECEESSTVTEDLQYFSVADWRKAVAMGTKKGVNSAAMDTIVEEPESDTSTKLTVREILRRFEDLGNKHFSDKLFLSDEEKTATLKQIHETLKCLEEKVRMFETQNGSKQQHEPARINRSPDGWRGGGRPVQKNRSHELEEESPPTAVNDGKHSLLQFAMHHFRASPEKFEMLKASDGSISGSLKVLESKNRKNKGAKDQNEWTWKEQVDLVKFTPAPIEQSLLRLDTPELSDLAVECFVCLMRYMGDLPMPTDVSEVKCVYTVLMHCHKFEQLRDEVYCHLMKQTTNNKSAQPESCQRGWRLFSIVAAYFVCSETLKPFLYKYLETAAYDKRRAYHGTATVCLQNLRKTFKYGGRKNVPSVEEITAISAGRNSKRQIYRLPGGTEKVVNTKSTTVVQDVIEELCVMINVDNPYEMEEFSVYCIVEGDTFTMPLAKEEYILDVTTELHKNHQVFYLIFCRSVWHFPLRLDSQLYVEVVFNQIAPDYLEGLLLVMPGETLEQEIVYDIARVAALLHRAADMTYIPSMKETKFLLPKPALGVRDIKPTQWVNMVQSNWSDCEPITTIQAKAQVLEILSKWPLFGSSFFAVKRSSEPKERADHILALNRSGVHFIDLLTHETILHYPFSEVISTRKVKSEDGTLFLDMKCGNLMQQRITRLQTDQAHEISRLIRQYITLQQRMSGGQQ